MIRLFYTFPVLLILFSCQPLVPLVSVDVEKGEVDLDAGRLPEFETKQLPQLQADAHRPFPFINKRHVILFVTDGMHLINEIAASRYLHGTDFGLVFHSFEYQGYVTTWNTSAYNGAATKLEALPYDPDNFDPVLGYDPGLGGNAPYPLSVLSTQDHYFLTGGSTDSAAAISAIMSGRKTDSGKINWQPDVEANGAVETIAEKLKRQRGFAVGIVSTVQFNHATPAGVLGHNPSRTNYSEDRKSSSFEGVPLAEEIILHARPEVVIGGGHPDWISGYLTEALYRELKKSDEYVFVERKAQRLGGAQLLRGAEKAVRENKKLFGLFGGKSGNFESPIPYYSPGKPGFLIHPENPTMSQAVRAALSVLARDKEGFIAVFEQGDLDWANHQNDYNRMIGCVNDLNNAVAAAVAFVEEANNTLDWNNTLLIVTSDHANGYLRLNENYPLGKGELPYEGDEDADQWQIRYHTGGHTNELVSLYATGAGAALFSDVEGRFYPNTHILDNTQIYEVIHEFAGAW